MDPIRSRLAVSLLRTLETEPGVELAKAMESVAWRSPLGKTLEVSESRSKKLVAEAGEGLRSYGVLNPDWLRENRGMEFHFFLVNAQPGWLDRLSKQVDSLSGTVSHYILYGVWDSLIVLLGTEEEARGLRQTIEETTYYELTYFCARTTVCYHRYQPAPFESGVELDLDLLNELVEGGNGTLEAQEEAQSTGLLLGRTWRAEDGSFPGVTAYTGLSLHGGGHEVDMAQLLRELRRHDSLRNSLVHLWEVDRGYPYHYFARLEAEDLDELDHATDSIAFTRLGRVSIEPDTFLVASGRHALPTLRSDGITLSASVDLRDIEEMAHRTLSDAGDEAVRAFNRLEAPTQLIILRSWAELRRRTEEGRWTPNVEASLRSMLESFAREALRGSDGARMAGPVLEVTTTLEAELKSIVQGAIDLVYGRDRGRAQRELKLRHRDVLETTMGQVVHVLREAREAEGFSFLADALDESRLKRLGEFTARHRNRWAHGGLDPDLAGELVIDEARRSIMEAIDLLDWLENDVRRAVTRRMDATSTTPKVDLEPATGHRDPGVFVSYSRRDAKTAKRVAEGLRALEYEVWYDDWAIAPGESIVERINEGLRSKDTLVVLLSPSSVRSRWVKKELNAALKAQLDGENVAVVPLLVERCEIPVSIGDLRYIDMTDGLDEGFVQLLEFLRERRSRAGDPCTT